MQKINTYASRNKGRIIVVARGGPFNGDKIRLGVGRTLTFTARGQTGYYANSINGNAAWIASE